MAQIEPGQMVTSRAGRDQGTLYCVLRMVDEKTVLVADGSCRSVRRPKTKNVKHLTVHQHFNSTVRQSMAAKMKITDEDIRKAVAKYHGGEEGSQGHGER